MKNSRQTVRPTPRLYLVIALATVLNAVGIFSNQVVAAQIGCFLLVLTGWAFLVSWLNFREVRIARRCPEQTFAREPFPVKCLLETVDARRPVQGLEYSDQLFGTGVYYTGSSAHSAVQAASAETDVVDSLAPGERGEIQHGCTIRNRGVYGAFEAQVASDFPFGLFQWSRVVEPVQSELIVYPHPEHPPVLQQLFAVGAGTGSDTDHFRRDVAGEFKGLREYDHGDPVKLIHWPLSARYQSLVVKDFDPVAPEEVIIIFHSYWADAQKRMPSPEYALQVLAGMFLALHQNGTELSFYAGFNAWEEIRVNDDPETLDAALEVLAKADVQAMATIDPLTTLIEDLPEDDRRVIVFSNVPKRHWRGLLGDDNALICLDCRLELDLNRLSAGSSRRRLEVAAT